MMKKIPICLILIQMFLFIAGCGRPEQPDKNEDSAEPDNSVFVIDSDSVNRSPKPGFLSVNTADMKELLRNTGRFDVSEIRKEFDGVDVFCELDRKNGNCTSCIFFTETDDSTKMISYNFTKEAVAGQSESSVRWGLDVLLRILDIELTDEIWTDILSVASRNEDTGALGMDFDGYSDPDTGIRLIYVDLGSNVQIDIR